VIAMKTLRGARLNDLRAYEREGGTFAQAAFRWVLSRPHVDALIVSMTSPEQIDEYLGASGRRASRAAICCCSRATSSATARRSAATAAARVCRRVPRRADRRGAAHAHVRRGLRAPELARAEYAALGRGAERVSLRAPRVHRRVPARHRHRVAHGAHARDARMNGAEG
jgi:hypothetical protein